MIGDNIVTGGDAMGWLAMVAAITMMVGYWAYTPIVRDDAPSVSRYSWAIWAVAHAMELITLEKAVGNTIVTGIYAAGAAFSVVIAAMAWLRADHKPPTHIDYLVGAASVLAFGLLALPISPWVAHTVTLILIPISFAPTL